jgi:hypothetical protein
VRLIRALMLLFAGLVLADAPALAQSVTSPAPDKVAVTIYRAPNRAADDRIDPEWLEGYALITEQRTVTIPAGRATIRFEGVAAGILPESAIVTGLPDGVREKNLDADLLSPRSLYDRSFGRPVTLRRPGPSGTIEERAIIRSGPDGAAILQTKAGFEVADCLGNDELIYDGVPAGLSAKPTLSIETEAPRGGQVTVTLSYLAWGFDWQANYVATMRPDGKSADLFAWVTLANSDVTSFANAETMVVAGKINREDARDDSKRWDDGEEEFEFQCLVSAVPVAPPVLEPVPSPMVMSVPMPAPALMRSNDAMEIIVTAQKRVTQEDLGDLKLYRVPDRTTIAAMAQKQVALLDKQAVPVEVIYRAKVNDADVEDVKLMLRAQNRKEKGLGLPLPAGPVAVFEPRGDQRLLVGQGKIDDKAINEEVEIDVASATQVTTEMNRHVSGNWADQELTVSNANPFPVRFEAELRVDADSYKRSKASARLGRKNGKDIWSVEVPANGSARLSYRLTEVRR